MHGGEGAARRVADEMDAVLGWVGLGWAHCHPISPSLVEASSSSISISTSISISIIPRLWVCVGPRMTAAPARGPSCRSSRAGELPCCALRAASRSRLRCGVAASACPAGSPVCGGGARLPVVGDMGGGSAALRQSSCSSRASPAMASMASMPAWDRLGMHHDAMCPPSQRRGLAKGRWVLVIGRVAAREKSDDPRDTGRQPVGMPK